jgi:O-antigen/teichoic acid export membrane protein
MRLGQTSVLYFLAKVVGSVLGFLATVYFARVLGEEVLGFYSLVLGIVTWLSLAGHVGLSKAITKRLSEGEERAQYAGAGLLVITVLLVVISLGVLALGEYVDAYVGAPVALFVVLLLFTDLFRSFTNAALKGSHLVHVYAVLSVVKMGGRSILQVALVALVGLELAGMLVGYAAGGFAVGVLGLWYLNFRPAVPARRHFRSLFEFAKFSWLGSMRSKTFSWVDVIVLGFFVPAGLIGIYAVAWSIGKFLDIFGSAISSTLFPEISKEATANNAEAVADLTENALAYAGLVLIPGLVGGVLLGDRLLAIYGEGFVAGAHILVILIAALLVYTYNKQLLNTLNAIDRPDLAFRANAVFVATNLSFNVLFVYAYGWVGAAVATALSAAVSLLFSFWYARTRVEFSLPIGEVGRQWVAATVMGLAVYGALRTAERHWIADYNEVFVVALVCVGAGVYVLSLLAISTRFRTTVFENLPIDVPLVRS